MQEHVMIHIMKQHWNMQKYLVKVEYKRAWSKLRSKLNNKHEINKKVKRDQKERSRLGQQPKSQQEKEGKCAVLAVRKTPQPKASSFRASHQTPHARVWKKKKEAKTLPPS